MNNLKNINIVLRNHTGTLISKFPKFKLPEKLKGGRIEKWGDYWIVVSKDYADAFIEILKDSREKPFKASIYLSGLLGIGYAINSNPDENEMRDCLQRHMNDSALLGSVIRNPDVDNHFNFLVDSFNNNLIRRLSFGIGSFLWIDNYPPECGVFKATCSYLKPRYVTFHERIIDVGFCGVWWNLRRKFEEFDINPEEWKSKEEASENQPEKAIQKEVAVKPR